MKKLSEIYLRPFSKLMDKLNYILEKLFDRIENEDISLDTFYKLSAAVEDLILFINKYAFPLLMKYIKDNELLREKLWDDFIEFRNLNLKLFADIEASLVKIENNLKNDEGKIDLSALKKYLEFVTVLFNNFGHIFMATVDYANAKIDEDEYRSEYETFKENLNENKKIFEKKFDK